MHRLFALAFAVAMLAAAQPALAVTSIHGFGFGPPAYAMSPDVDPAAAAYCRSTGGVVEVRVPVFGTNNSSAAQLQLAGRAPFCKWTSKKDGSRIYTFLSTLNTTMPTLAALAYYAKVPTSKATCPGGANPASCYCTYLGGSDLFGGANLAGGAWVLKGSADVDLETCVFPDLSSIDSWGLAYHANNIIRGTDLSRILKYRKP